MGRSARRVLASRGGHVSPLRRRGGWRVEAASHGPVNLAVRLGPIVDGRRILGHVDIDGTDGVDPGEALERLLPMLPEATPTMRTSKGFRLLFWSRREILDGLLPEFGAEVAANAGRLSQIPPSRHPSGYDYEWMHEPRDELPPVDLEALGLTPQPKGGHTAARDARPLGPLQRASGETQAAFADLLARVGIHEGHGERRDGRGEFFVSP